MPDPTKREGRGRLAAWLPAGLRRLLVAGFNRVYDGLAPERRAYRHWIERVYTAHGLDQRRRMFLEIAHFAHVNRPIEGYYFEFGCHEANTMRMAYDCFRHLFDWHYVAFDSFEGLPEIEDIDRQDIWEKGKLATSEERFRKLCRDHGIPDDRLTTIKGFYDKSLGEETRRRLAGRKAAVIYVDCDLYHSTVPVLAFCKDFLQPGTVIVFDDWNCFRADPNKGERRAWAEFRAANPDLHFEAFYATGLQKAFVYTGARADGGDRPLE